MDGCEVPSLTVHDPVLLREAIGAHLQGSAPLTGLDLYYRLERATSLLTFHTMLRGGPRNRTRDGLQQSYGDHNRLLMLALDRLLAGDYEWLRRRVAAEGAPDDASLRRCADTAHDLELTREALLALWLGAALHDCGMLCGEGAHIDVEDGIAIARPILAEYCPADLQALAEFALRHHDYVKDAFLGEVPVGIVTADLDRLEPDEQVLGLTALGLIQVAGAASLGEGRLTDFRLRIFEACLDGTALADRSPVLRLARLLGPSPDPDPGAVAPPDVDAAHSVLDGLAPPDRTAIGDFLSQTSVHGWQSFVRHAGAARRCRTLALMASWNQGWHAEHVVIDDSLRVNGDGCLPSSPATVVRTALSGCKVVKIAAPGEIARLP